MKPRPSSKSSSSCLSFLDAEMQVTHTQLQEDNDGHMCVGGIEKVAGKKIQINFYRLRANMES